MVINPVVVNNQPLSHSSQISLFLNPKFPLHATKKKSEATEPEPNPYLFRKEDDEVGAAVGEERQDFEAWILRERRR